MNDTARAALEDALAVAQQRARHCTDERARAEGALASWRERERQAVQQVAELTAELQQEARRRAGLSGATP